MCLNRFVSTEKGSHRASRKQEPTVVKKRLVPHAARVPVTMEETMHTYKTSSVIVAPQPASVDPESPWGFDEQQALV